MYNEENNLSQEADQFSLVETYQCPGCVHGANVQCGYFKSKAKPEMGCANHVPGVLRPNVGKLLLGMPNGFCRIGMNECRPGNYLYLYNDVNCDDFESNMFQIPLWKHLDSRGNTLLRTALPRLGTICIAVIAGNNLEHFDCLEITEDDISKMD